MQKLLTFILLLSHINFCMFIAQVDEVDVYDKNGQQLTDINTLAEYINYAIGNNQQVPVKDEDDDNARYFHIVKLDTYFFNQQVVEIKKQYSNARGKIKYPPHIQEKLAIVFVNIQSPPPEA